MEEKFLKDLFEEEGHWWHTAKRKLICNFIKGNNKRILVLGVGGGILCQELLDAGFEVTGVDVASIVCAHVKNMRGLNVVQHNLEQALPFQDRSFEIIIMADVLEHIEKDQALLEDVWRCLTPGGQLLLSVPAYQHMWSYWDESMMHFRRYERKGLAALIRSVGFKIRKITFFHVLIYPAAAVWRKCFPANKKESDFKFSKGNGVMTALMGVYYATERQWIRRFQSFPFGLSLFVCAEK